MLQTGALIRDLSVRELVAMMASLYPHPLAVDEVLELDADRGHRRPADAEALRRPDAARPLRVALVSNPDLLVLDEPTVAMDVEARHAFWTTMRDVRRAAARPCSSPRTTSRRPTRTPTASS